jgi:hypothetical protein
MRVVSVILEDLQPPGRPFNPPIDPRPPINLRPPMKL